MTENIYKDKTWIFGIVVAIIVFLLSIIIPNVFEKTEVIFGMTLVIVGILMIYQILRK